MEVSFCQSLVVSMHFEFMLITCDVVSHRSFGTWSAVISRCVPELRVHAHDAYCRVPLIIHADLVSRFAKIFRCLADPRVCADLVLFDVVLI